MTAAHCFELGDKSAFDKDRLFYNPTLRFGGGAKQPVGAIVRINPQYNGDTATDYALLELDQPGRFHSGGGGALLSTGGGPGDQAYAIGAGPDRRNGDPVANPLISGGKIFLAHGDNGSSVLYGYSRDGDCRPENNMNCGLLCKGDSGGPLRLTMTEKSKMRRSYVIGVASRIRGTKKKCAKPHSMQEWAKVNRRMIKFIETTMRGRAGVSSEFSCKRVYTHGISCRAK